MNYKKLIIICCLLFLGISNNAFARRSARDKACLSNIRVIQGAVEMYNMDVSTMIEELNPKTMSFLVKGGYLKVEPVKPETQCEYKSVGNLTNNGIIYCPYHGDVDHLIYSEYYKDDEYDQYEKLPQNTVESVIELKKDRILKERERLKRKIDFKYNLLSYIPVAAIVIFLGAIIWEIITKRKKSK